MCNTVAELTALIDGSGRLGRTMGGYAARERKLFEQFLHAALILRNIGIDLAVGPVQIIIGNVEISAVTGTG